MRTHFLGVLVLVGTATVAAAFAGTADPAPPAACASPGRPAVTSTNPPELGIVTWRRGYDAAKAEAQKSGRPLLVLFDEVPGCSTVNAFGHDVLSDAVVADAADLFVSVFVSNNEAGDDRRVLEHFGEPTWNNPVVRFIDVDEHGLEHELAPRLEGADRSVHLLTRMVQALRAAQQTIPPWLQAGADNVAAGADDAVYATACFWDGEVRFGGVDGVVATTPGFVGGREVVKVRYDRARLSKAALDAAALGFGFGTVDGGFTVARGDDKKQIQHNALGKLPLSPSQRMHVNSAVGRGDNPRVWLSPRQQQLLDATACQGGPR